jgi:hypothetical protein
MSAQKMFTKSFLVMALHWKMGAMKNSKKLFK